MRPRISRVTRVVAEGDNPLCSCGGKVMYFNDFGVKCYDCNKLYGTWNVRENNGNGSKRNRSVDIGPHQYKRDNTNGFVFDHRKYSSMQGKTSSQATCYSIVPYQKFDLAIVEDGARLKAI